MLLNKICSLTKMTLGCLVLSVSSCQKEKSRFIDRAPTSGIDFENTLSYTNDFNPYTYRNFYNGGGVALGDINNDGWIDIYLTGNQTDNKLYLNQGDWKFVDITEIAGVASSGVWSTGATFADLNGDGYLDLYVCKSGKPQGENRHNELFINNGDLSFTEQSKQYGLDLLGLSVHAAFFDFDLDGDLDCYVLNNSTQSIGGYDLIQGQRDIPDPDGLGNKLLIQENNRFIDITEDQNIYTSAIGFGLGITLSDFNADRRPDLFISNDFFEKDYLYYNFPTGFQEVLEQNFSSISMGSMGADAADMDNDLLADLMVTEMLPSTLERQKTKALYESWDKYQLAVSQGYYHQYPRNTLQRNVGEKGFVEIGRYAGVMATDWSWASLLFDADNDGFKDLFVANGIFQDLLDRDYLDYTANDQIVTKILENRQSGLKELIDLIPSHPIANVMFQNKGDFKFTDMTNDWGLNTPSFSNGSAYGDLDNDGDLDLVINNVNDPCFVYENKTDTSQQKFLSISLQSHSLNTKSIGAKAIIKYGGSDQQMVEQFPSRGFQSSISNRLHFGLGHHDVIDSLIILWPNDKTSLHTNISTNQHIRIQEPRQSNYQYQPLKTSNPILKSTPLFDFVHQENNWSDFNREQLLIQMYSNQGPALAKGDINHDGIEDFFVGGAKNQSSSLIVSHHDGYQIIEHIFQTHATAEDTVAKFIDLNQDGFLDLYVGTSGRAFSNEDRNLKDRVYINHGEGIFEWVPRVLPQNLLTRTSDISSLDFNKDGLMDLFLTQNIDGSFYGPPADAILLKGLPNGTFRQEKIPQFQDLGLMTSAETKDINGDGWTDILVAGHWTNILVFLNEKGTFNTPSKHIGLDQTSGLWNTLVAQDFDRDGDIDLFAGNHGTNTMIQSGYKMFVNDFDSNGSIEQIICAPHSGNDYPIADRKDLIAQLPYLKRIIPSHEIYSKMPIQQLLSQQQIQHSRQYQLEELESCYFENQNGLFVKQTLPSEIQYAPIYSLAVKDVNHDHQLDLILGGNQYLVKPQFGRYDASHGLIVYGSKDGAQFKLDQTDFLGISGQIRNLELIQYNNKLFLIAAINNEAVQFFEFQ